MPIKEEAFRIGCGRYLQKPNLLSECGEEFARYGKAPLIVGGKTALSLTKEKIEKSISGISEKYEFIEHRGTCNEPRAEEIARYAVENGFDLIVGVGGGVLMDFAKLIAHFAALPVVNVPTSSATCAAYTPLSVRYTPEGNTVGSIHFKHEVDAVLADTEILAAQPTRLLLAGVFDAMAKFVEIKQRFDPNDENAPLGLEWAYLMSKRSFAQLNDDTPLCLAELEEGKLTPRSERLFFTTIAVTGVISGIARGSNQTALAHKFYEATRYLYFHETRSYLHGEIVGVGLLLQNHFNRQPENNENLLSVMKRYGMPRSLPGIGLTPDSEMLEAYYDKLKAGSAICETDPDELSRLTAGLKSLFQYAE